MMLVCCLVMSGVTLYMCFANSRLRSKNKWLKSEAEYFRNQLDWSKFQRLSMVEENHKLLAMLAKLQTQTNDRLKEKIDEFKAECCRDKCCQLNKEK